VLKLFCSETRFLATTSSSCWMMLVRVLTGTGLRYVVAFVVAIVKPANVVGIRTIRATWKGDGALAVRRFGLGEAESIDVGLKGCECTAFSC
jgi:hypothetical protein